MAVAGSNLANGNFATGGGSPTFTVSGVTPSANALVLLSIFGTGDSNSILPTSVSGGLTWVLVKNQAGSSNGFASVYRALGNGSPTGTISITFNSIPSAQTGYSIDQFTGVDTSGTNGSGAVVQSVGKGVAPFSSTTGDSVTLSALASAGNASFGAIAINVGSTIGAGSGYSSLSSSAISGGAQESSEYKAAGSTTVDWSWASAFQQQTSIVGIEIAAGSVGGDTLSVQQLRFM